MSRIQSAAEAVAVTATTSLTQGMEHGLLLVPPVYAPAARIAFASWAAKDCSTGGAICRGMTTTTNRRRNPRYSPIKTPPIDQTACCSAVSRSVGGFSMPFSSHIEDDATSRRSSRWWAHWPGRMNPVCPRMLASNDTGLNGENPADVLNPPFGRSRFQLHPVAAAAATAVGATVAYRIAERIKSIPTTQ